MRTSTRLMAVAALLSVFAVGCAGPERKLGRGISNSTELLRFGEISKSIEHANLSEGPRAAYSTGLVKGISRTIQRTAVGLYEVVTFPIPSYDPVMGMDKPVFPESYKPGTFAGASTDTDAAMGFAGGEVAPFIPGSRFRIFEN